EWANAHSRWAPRSGPDREVSSGKDDRRGSPPSCRRVGGGLGAEHYPNLATGERCYFTTESLTSFRLSWRAPLRERPTSAGERRRRRRNKGWRRAGLHLAEAPVAPGGTGG